MIIANEKLPLILATHIRAEDSGEIPLILQRKNIPYITLRLNKGEELPTDISQYRGVIIFGGLQSANDDHINYIRKELYWLEKVIEMNFPVFGICLGAQLVARTLGARVMPHPSGFYEFGWYELEPFGHNHLDICESSFFYQRHGEVFDLPKDAKLSITGYNFENQGFTFKNNVIATQFHPEINSNLLEHWLKRARPLPDETLYGAQAIEMQIEDSILYIPKALSWLDKALDKWLLTSEDNFS